MTREQTEAGVGDKDAAGSRDGFQMAWWARSLVGLGLSLATARHKLLAGCGSVSQAEMLIRSE